MDKLRWFYHKKKHAVHCGWNGSTIAYHAVIIVLILFKLNITDGSHGIMLYFKHRHNILKCVLNKCCMGLLNAHNRVITGYHTG